MLKLWRLPTHDFGELTGILKGNTSLMFSETGNAPAKVIKNFRKKLTKPMLKGAFIEEAIYIGDDHIDALVAIKSKEELIGEIITLLQSPCQKRYFRTTIGRWETIWNSQNTFRTLVPN